MPAAIVLRPCHAANTRRRVSRAAREQVLVDGKAGCVRRHGAKKLRVEFTDGTKRWCSAPSVQPVATAPVARAAASDTSVTAAVTATAAAAAATPQAAQGGRGGVRSGGGVRGGGSVCNLCKQPGHVAKRCPWPDGKCPHAVCAHCGVQGHTGKACDYGAVPSQRFLYCVGSHRVPCFPRRFIIQVLAACRVKRYQDGVVTERTTAHRDTRVTLWWRGGGWVQMARAQPAFDVADPRGSGRVDVGLRSTSAALFRSQSIRHNTQVCMPPCMPPSPHCPCRLTLRTYGLSSPPHAGDAVLRGGRAYRAAQRRSGERLVTGRSGAGCSHPPRVHQSRAGGPATRAVRVCMPARRLKRVTLPQLGWVATGAHLAPRLLWGVLFLG